MRTTFSIELVQGPVYLPYLAYGGELSAVAVVLTFACHRDVSDAMSSRVHVVASPCLDVMSSREFMSPR